MTLRALVRCVSGWDRSRSVAGRSGMTTAACALHRAAQLATAANARRGTPQRVRFSAQRTVSGRAWGSPGTIAPLAPAIAAAASVWLL